MGRTSTDENPSLPCVPGRDAGTTRELFGTESLAPCERRIKTEPIAEVHAEQLERANRGAEEALDQRVTPVAGVGRCYACLLVSEP